jgi:hypothetical protein
MATTKDLAEIRARKSAALQLQDLSQKPEPIEYQAPSVTTWQVLPEHTLTKRLFERRISPETIALFEITPEGKGWIYPAAGGRRWKNFDSDSSLKYAWKPSKPERAEFYHGPDLVQAIQAARGACWLVSGEPDVWALRSAGIAHALSGFTESTVSNNLAPFIASLGVTVLYIAPDLDPTGQSWSSKVARALEGSGIELDCRELPADLGEHGDIGKAWQRYTKLMDFERWLIGLPRVYPEPEPERVSELKPQSGGAQAVIPDEYRFTIIERLGVQSFNGKGWSSKKIKCPFHGDEDPSAKVQEYKGLYCYTEGTWYGWQKLGIELGIGSISEWSISYSSANITQDLSRISLSNELRAALARAGDTASARVLDALYMLGWQPGRIFTRAEAIKALSGKDSPVRVAPWSVRLALEPGTTKDRETIKSKKNYCGFFPPYILQLVTMEKSHNKSKVPRGRRSKSYKLPAPGEIAERLGVELKPAHTDPIEPAKLTNKADYRAEIYATLPRLKPGTYSRKTLADRIGASKRTAQNYDKRAGLKVTERFERVPITGEKLAELPETLEPGTKRNLWLENGELYTLGKSKGKPRRFAPTLTGAQRALESSPGKALYLVTQKTNHYGPG